MEFKFDDVYDCCHLLANVSVCWEVPGSCADTGMWTRVALSISLILVFVCSLSTCVPQACFEVLQVAAIGSVVCRSTWLA